MLSALSKSRLSVNKHNSPSSTAKKNSPSTTETTDNKVAYGLLVLLGLCGIVALVFGIIFINQQTETTASVEATVTEDPVIDGDQYQLTVTFTVPSIGPSTKTIMVYRTPKPKSEGYGYRDIPNGHKKKDRR